MIKKKFFKKIKSKKIRHSIKNVFKNNLYFLNKRANLLFYSENINYFVNIKITPNNIFCCLKSNKAKTLLLLTAGILKINVTKKKLKFISKYILQKFLKNLRSIKQKFIFLNIQGPQKVKKNLLKQILSSLKYNKILINLNENKSFNGCRPKKVKRKKRKGFRILK